MTFQQSERRESALKKMRIELSKAYKKHPRNYHSRHEFFGILKEEVDEVWDIIKQDGGIEHLETEILQVMVVCLRFLETNTEEE